MLARHSVDLGLEVELNGSAAFLLARLALLLFLFGHCALIEVSLSAT